MQSQFPFVLHGFHSSNGSKYVNRDVAAMLKKSCILNLPQPPRLGNDLRLTNTINVAIIHKLFGYDHIRNGMQCALMPSAVSTDAINFRRFCAELSYDLNPLLSPNAEPLRPNDQLRFSSARRAAPACPARH